LAPSASRRTGTARNGASRHESTMQQNVIFAAFALVLVLTLGVVPAGI
jgi:hypothetical protein